MKVLQVQASSRCDVCDKTAKGIYILKEHAVGL